MPEKSLFLKLTEAEPPASLFGHDVEEPILYHYTGFDSLLSITESEELWATNIHCLNDYEEFKGALSLAKEHINFLKQSEEGEVSEFLDKMFDKVDAIEQLNLHVFSFTANGDLLSQWRAYCPDGGVAVGFRYNDLLKLAKQGNFVIRKCIYSEEDKQSIMRDVVDIHVDIFKTKEETPDVLLNGFLTVLSVVAPCFKNKAFEEEQEWRLISEPISVNDQRVGIKAKNNLMTPYVRFSLGGLPNKKNKQNLSFDRYVIGPSRNSEIIHSTFSYFLNRYELYYDNYSRSKIPYRTF